MRLANRPPAHAEVGGQLHLAEVVAGPVLPGGDRRPERLARTLTQRAPIKTRQGLQSQLNLLARFKHTTSCQQSAISLPTVRRTEQCGHVDLGDAEPRLPAAA